MFRCGNDAVPKRVQTIPRARDTAPRRAASTEHDWLGKVGDMLVVDDTKLYVVLDTNTWRDSFGLTTRSASIVRFFLNRKNATLAVPEVVSLELLQVLGKALKAARQRIQHDHKALLSVFGALPELSLPSCEQIDTQVVALVTNTGVPYVDIPITLSAAKRALSRMIERKAPCSGGEQFRDGVIWENCLELLKHADVYLVTRDSAFYMRGSNQKDHLVAPDLQADVEGYPHTLRLFSTIEELLKEIRSDVTVDEALVKKSVFAMEHHEIDETLGAAGFRLEGETQATITPYFTECATQLHFTFELRKACVDATPQRRESEGLTFRGWGLLDTATNTIKKLHVSHLRFSYVDGEGEKRNTGSVRGIASPIVIGPKRVAHAFRLPLDYAASDG